MRRWLLRNGTQAVLAVMATLARLEGPGAVPARGAIAGLGAAVARLRGVRASRSPAELGATWQRAFGAKKQVPIVRVDDTTAYGEIHTRCPLRGTGDVAACHRMMEYDRAFMRRAGARFVVLRSQAEPSVTVCEIAIRDTGLPADDLVAAHER